MAIERPNVLTWFGAGGEVNLQVLRVIKTAQHFVGAWVMVKFFWNVFKPLFSFSEIFDSGLNNQNNRIKQLSANRLELDRKSETLVDLIVDASTASIA